MKKALVTGGAGFLGSHLCRRLLGEGYKVYALDNLYTGSEDNIADLRGSSDFRFIQDDVIDATGSWQRIRGIEDVKFDEIYNLACPASPVHYQARPIFTTKTSVFGILNMLELAKAHGAKLLHTSTSEVYGDPAVHPQVESYWGNVNTIGIRSCYDEGKRVAETFAADYIREYDVDVRMVRIFNTYGPNMHPQDGRVISNFIMQALRNEDITIFGDGSQTRSFQYCDDLIEAFRRYMALEKGVIRDFFDGRAHTPGAPHPAVPVINTGNPSEYTIKQLAEKTIELVNESAVRLGLPTSTSRLIYKPLPPDDPKKRKPDITLAKALLNGWELKIPLKEGLAKTIEYFRGKYGQSV